MRQTLLIFCILITSLSAQAAVSFESSILPILKDRCFKCHLAPHKDPKTGKMKKPKADLIMESRKHFVKGGESGQVIVPGKPEKSLLFDLITLPEADDDLMPPKGGKLRNDQIALIKKWIEEGARFGNWVGKTGIVTKTTQRKPLSTKGSVAFLAAEISQGHAIPTPQMLGDAQLPGVIINPIAEGQGLLRVVAVQQRDMFDDLSLDDMSSIFPFITELLVRKTVVSDEGLDYLAQMPNLTMLDLSRTDVTGKTLSLIKDLPYLSSLNLVGTALDKSSLATLSEMKKLRYLYLGETGLNESDIKKLRSKLPNTDIQGNMVFAE